MLTQRGWWFFVVLLGLCALGVAAQAPTILLIAFTLLSWFLGQWLVFTVRVRRAESRWIVRRQLRDERGPLTTLWARLPFTVQVALDCPANVHLPFVSIIDRVPALLANREGDCFADGALATQTPLEIHYRAECAAPGRLRFEGVLARIVDLQGFFAVRTFIRAVETYRVLPVIADARGHIPSVKRHNLIPLVGQHPHRRPGSGSELLDLREYLPGDPPKMIAWKASARRDRLMTKEFESEVPVRCTLFVDASNSVRVGTVGRNALARVVEIAAAVAQANASERDLTGVCLFDENGVRRLIKPGRGAAHLVKMNNALADAAAQYPRTDEMPLARLVTLACGALQDIYPDLLAPAVNSWPWLAALFPSWFFSSRLYRWRKQLSAVMAVRYGLGPGGVGLLLEDDTQCRRYAQRFLIEHQVPFPMPFYDAQARYLFGAPGKLEVLARALMRSVLHGRDNELFVLLVDFLETGPRLEKVLRAARVAISRHHKVIVICPWPPSVDLPTRRPRTPVRTEPLALQDLLGQAAGLRLKQAFVHVRQAFARLGIPVLAAPQDEAIGLVLQRMQELRSLERGVR